MSSKFELQDLKLALNSITLWAVWDSGVFYWLLPPEPLQLDGAEAGYLLGQFSTTLRHLPRSIHG